MRHCETQSVKRLARAMLESNVPEESQSPLLRKAFQRVYEFSPFNEILRKWIVTKYFRRSVHYWSANTHFLRVDRGHAYLRGRSRSIAVCPHTYVPTRASSSRVHPQPFGPSLHSPTSPIVSVLTRARSWVQGGDEVNQREPNACRDTYPDDTHSGMITLTCRWNSIPSARTDFRRGQSHVRSVHAFARPHKRIRGSRS